MSKLMEALDHAAARETNRAFALTNALFRKASKWHQHRSDPIKTRKPTKQQRRENLEFYRATDEEIRALAVAGFRVNCSRVKMLIAG